MASWEPERYFMIFSAYFDESGTHAGAPVSKPTKSDGSYRGNMFWVGLNGDSLDSLHEQQIDIANGRAAIIPSVLRRNFV
jgi:hypothetical protein